MSLMLIFLRLVMDSNNARKVELYAIV
jgi:hypothetical protein